GGDGFTFSRAIGETECTYDGLLNETLLAAVAESKEFHLFKIDPAQVKNVKKSCLPNALNYPLLEEYDFHNDTINLDLEIELKPQARPRPYQEEILSRMFGNGRARSEIIVLPCGAGKSLVGVSAACRIKKSCLCVATNVVPVDHGLIITSFGSNIPDELLSKKIIEEIRNREWGLLLMDEVHVVPTPMVCKVISVAKSHCKLGLTATLRRMKSHTNLNVLIGPKLYEANRMDLVRGENFEKRNQVLSVMNPNKFRACEFLIRFHEQERGDKIIVLSDNIFALKKYAKKLHKPMVHRGIRSILAYKFYNHLFNLRQCFILKRDVAL
ncbi:DNA repair helicase XPB1-like protein, partial [Tanacetum coccineum]